MTRAPTFPELAVLTLKDPYQAAQVILGWKLPKEAIWTAIALVSVISTILWTLWTLYTLQFLAHAPLSLPPFVNAILANPFIFFLIAAAGFIAMVHAIYWTGRMLGGTGAVEDLMVLFLWLQGLRVAAQAGVMVLQLLVPALADLAGLIVLAATLWIFVHFTNIGLHLNSMMRASVVLVVGATGLVVGLSFLLSLIGVSAEGVLPNV